jgi:hypothetical protein
MPTIKEFGGLDNQNSPTEYGLKRLQVAENVDISRNNKLSTRKGRKRLITTSIDVASATKSALLYQSGSDLFKVSDLSGGILVDSNLFTANWLHSTEINNKIYWSNGIDSGVIENNSSRKLGISTPITPSYSQIVGLMPQGSYLYAITYTRNDGLESGAGLSGQATINNGGIHVNTPSNIPDDASHINLYLSTVNGDVLYLARSVAISVASLISIDYTGDTLNFGIAITNQFCDKPVAFQTACYYRGRMYYAHGNVLWESLPFNFELINYSQDFVAFDGDILMCAEVNDGIYVATKENTYFLSGSNSQDFTLSTVLNYGAIQGSPVSIQKIGDKPNGMLWASNKGAIAGFDGGQVVNMTDGVFSFGEAGSASGLYREQNGQNHIVISFNSETVPYNARRIIMLSNIDSPPADIGGLVSVGELLNASIESIPMNVDAENL